MFQIKTWEIPPPPPLSNHSFHILLHFINFSYYIWKHGKISPSPQKKTVITNHSFPTLSFFINFSYHRMFVRVTPGYNSITFSVTCMVFEIQINHSNKQNFFFFKLSLNRKKFSFNFHTWPNFQEIIQFFPIVEVSSWIITLDKTSRK